MPATSTASINSLHRLHATNAQVVMERVVEAGLVERGVVAIISVEAIRDRTGERWPRKRDDVAAYVHRKCMDYLSVSDIHQRINDTDFLIAVSSDHPAAVQAAALRILEEVLVFFLGAAETPDLKIRTVTGYSATGEIACAGLDPRTIARTPIYVDNARSPYRRSIDPIEERKRNPVSFVTATGEVLQVSFTVEPVVSLRHQVTAAIRILPTVTQLGSGAEIPTRLFGKLSDDDLNLVDLATLEFGALFLARAGERTQPALFIPVSFRTMSSRKGRHALVQVGGGVTDVLKASVMAEFVDVDRGTPAGRLTEVAGLVSSVCRGVLVRLQAAKDMTLPVRGFKPHGLTFDLSDFNGSDARLADHILAFGEQGKAVAPALMALGLPNDGFFDVAAVAGLSHASVRAPALDDQMTAA